MPFASLGLSSALARAMKEQGFAQPTPVQAAAIPAALAGRDVQARAQTGSGKTVAFALPILQQLQNAPRATPRRTQALVLVPTREIAVQVGEVVRDLARHLYEPLRVAVAFGGVSINPQMMGLRGGADIVVATPGRLLDLLDHNALSLRSVATLVLDEADRLLDAGFADEIKRILSLLSKRRQNLLFSATYPPGVQALVQALLHEPVRIDLPMEPATAPDIEQHAVHVDAARRTQLLRYMIEQGSWTRVLVFVATRYATEHVADKLCRLGIKALSLHGDLTQGARLQALGDFKFGRAQVLVATDLAARGLDIAQLPVVVNYDLPRSPTDYVHRIGRTGRAQARGLAVSFISTGAAEAHFRLIEKRQGQRLPREQIEGFEPKEALLPQAVEGGGVKGKRKSKKDKLREAAAGSSKGYPGRHGGPASS